MTCLMARARRTLVRAEHAIAHADAMFDRDFAAHSQGDVIDDDIDRISASSSVRRQSAEEQHDPWMLRVDMATIMHSRRMGGETLSASAVNAGWRASGTGCRATWSFRQAWSPVTPWQLPDRLLCARLLAMVASLIRPPQASARGSPWTADIETSLRSPASIRRAGALAREGHHRAPHSAVRNPCRSR